MTQILESLPLMCQTHRKLLASGSWLLASALSSSVQCSSSGSSVADRRYSTLALALVLVLSLSLSLPLSLSSSSLFHPSLSHSFCKSNLQINLYQKLTKNSILTYIGIQWEELHHATILRQEHGPLCFA